MSNIIKFKRPKLERGIVAPGGIMSIKGNSMHLARSYLPEDIFYYAMYWDKIAIPSSPSIHIGLPLEDELSQLGILERPTMPLIGTVEAARHVHWTFGEIAKQKLKEDKSDWVIHHMSGDPIYLPEHSTKKDVIRLKITNALPIPSADGKFSLDDLLDFKFRRSAELEGLHITMDKFLKKLHSEELDVIQKTELIRFENAIQELDKTVLERFKVYKKSDLEINLELTGALALTIPAIVQDIQSNKIPLATIATSIISCLTLSKTYGVTFNQYNHGDFNLEYISSARSENIIF